MKRWPLVLSGTVAGLTGVLTFHTTQPRSGFPLASGVTSPSGGAPAASPAATPRAGAAGTPAGTPAAPGQPASGTRTAVGPQVDYNFGILSVRVTVSGERIVRVGIASIDDGGNPRSVYIDQQAIPVLEQEVMQAQSANIQGVSGASYTSAGFVQSLQSALHSLAV